MNTTRTTKHAADWLAAHPAPIHKSDVPAWSGRVKAELGEEALSELVELLADGDLEEQYQAVAAARVLGAEIWADGEEPELAWLVKLPGEDDQRRVYPSQQLAG
jgi:HEAT repeat protein